MVSNVEQSSRNPNCNCDNPSLVKFHVWMTQRAKILSNKITTKWEPENSFFTILLKN